MPSSPLCSLRFPLGIASWCVFALSLLIYWLTADPGGSYWDCPEYVTAGSLLEVGHPPGNPVWMLAMRVATIPFPSELHAYVINLCSGICMAFAAFFLCRVIFINTFFGLKHILHIKGQKYTILWVTSFISMGSAFCFSFCDSAWFSAVEAEVYSMSAMLTGASLWIMVLWWWEKSKTSRMRLLILLAYLIGLSIGVHQLNLLCIPVYALIILYRKYPNRINPLFVILTLLGGVALIACILLVLMPCMLDFAASFELLFVNRLDCTYNTGLFVFIFTVAFLILLAIYYTNKTGKFYLESSLWMLAFILLGYSSFGIIMIRSMANPFMNEGAPSDIFSLKSYIQRDQYPSTPLLFGHTPYSMPMFQETFIDDEPFYSRYILEKGKPIFIKLQPGAMLAPRSGFLSHQDSIDNQIISQERNYGYLLSDYTFSQKLTPELDMWFPRITSRNVSDRDAYTDWAGMTEDNMDKVPISETIDSLGNLQPRMNILGKREQTFSYRPTYAQNLRFFLSYQAFYMYFRYLLWNFAGRQNDYHSTGEIEHGNFITGFDFIDSHMIGNLQNIPPEIWNENPGHNNYYSIPLLIGLFGFGALLIHSRRSRRVLSVSGIFFLMTGLVIVLYLNQSPGEPRERDYTFLGSYMAFSMWIAAGFTFLSVILFRYLPKKIVLVSSFIIAFFPAALMAAENFDDHDRRGRFEPTFYASSLLDFEQPSIIFSHGDNSTFPLWYASEVMKMGKNHIPIDVTYLSLPSYVVGLQEQNNKKLETIASPRMLAYGAFLLTRIPPDSDSRPMHLAEALKDLYDSGSLPAVWPTSKVLIPYNNTELIEINLHDFTQGSSYLSFKHLMLLDILASQSRAENPRSLYFPGLIDWNLYKPLKPLLKEALFGKIYNPSLTDSASIELMKKSIYRERDKIRNLSPKPHYADPLIADRSQRYRGEMIMAAKYLLQKGDTTTPQTIIESIEDFYPYSSLSAGTFTVEDSTYYEGKEYLRLLKDLYHSTKNEYYLKKAEDHQSHMETRHQQWLRYYHSLSPSQRKTLSSRSLRLILPLD